MEREAARTEKPRTFVYSRRWMADTPEKQARVRGRGAPPAVVVRLKMPREGVCRFHDLVRGEMEFEWAREQDHVIQRADGSCLYHLANVVDDHDMRISHVIRAEEHLVEHAAPDLHRPGARGTEPASARPPPVRGRARAASHKLSKRKLDEVSEEPGLRGKLHEHGRRGSLERLGLHVPTRRPSTRSSSVSTSEIGFLPESVAELPPAAWAGRWMTARRTSRAPR